MRSHSFATGVLRRLRVSPGFDEGTDLWKESVGGAMLRRDRFDWPPFSGSIMDGPSFKARLKLLGRTQVDFAGEIEVALRTVHNWAAKGAPAEVARLLDLMTLLERPFDAPGGDAGSDTFHRCVAHELDRLMCAAGQDRRGALIESIERWLQIKADPANREAGNTRS